MILGIDPGASGALVLLNVDGTPIEWMRMPTMIVGRSTRVNAAALARFLDDYHIKTAYLENVHSMPKQGVASSFNFGHACGVIEGVLGALVIPVRLVTPQKWKRAAGLIGADKDASRVKAIQVWPFWSELDKIGEGQAYADAALIARFGDA
jgi:crossover junction endodeoxyribonuclease RuvC